MSVTSNACSDYNALDAAQLLELVLVCSWQLNRFFIHCTITSFVLSCLACVRIAIGEKACPGFTEVCFRVLSSKIDCLEWFRQEHALLKWKLWLKLQCSLQLECQPLGNPQSHQSIMTAMVTVQLITKEVNGSGLNQLNIRVGCEVHVLITFLLALIMYP